jgi:hypothetical protein
MDRQAATEVSWSPLQGSYEEAVLSWYEQVEMSFRRRQIESERTGHEARTRAEQVRPQPAAPDYTGR